MGRDLSICRRNVTQRALLLPVPGSKGSNDKSPRKVYYALFYLHNKSITCRITVTTTIINNLNGGTARTRHGSSHKLIV
jgi:hypothetical protein